MTIEEFGKLFNDDDDNDGEFLNFEVIENKRSNRPDLHAFLMLDEMMPSNNHRNIVGCAEHDEIYLQPDPVKLAAIITREQVIDLIRCGVRYDRSTGSLAMFV